MSKPIIFFSHSSKDSVSLMRLKELFVEKTGGAIEVFVSSDGQSIPFGRNWVKRIEEALSDARIMFVFLTPHSISSKWLYFESGYAYSKGLRVIPVGFKGIDLNEQHPPLSLLQGFNIGSADALNNIITITNEEFSHRHASQFADSEFQEILFQGENGVTSNWGNLGEHIDYIRISISSDSIVDLRPDMFAWVTSYAEKENRSCQTSDNEIIIDGLRFHGDRTNNRFFLVEIDPTLFLENLTFLTDFFTTLRKERLKNLFLEFEFVPDVLDCEWRPHIASARVRNTGVMLGDKRGFKFKSLSFTLDGYFARNGVGRRPRLIINTLEDKISIDEIKEIFDILLAKNLIWYS